MTAIMGVEAPARDLSGLDPAEMTLAELASTWRGIEEPEPSMYEGWIIGGPLDGYSTRGASPEGLVVKYPARGAHPASYAPDLPFAGALVRTKLGAKGCEVARATLAALKLAPAERAALDARPLRYGGDAIDPADMPLADLMATWKEHDPSDAGRLDCYATRGASDGPARDYRKHAPEAIPGARTLDDLLTPTPEDKRAWAARPIELRGLPFDPKIHKGSAGAAEFRRLRKFAVRMRIMHRLDGIA